MRHGVDTTFLVAVEVACHPYHARARALAETLRRPLRDHSASISARRVYVLAHCCRDLVRRLSAGRTAKRLSGPICGKSSPLNAPRRSIAGRPEASTAWAMRSLLMRARMPSPCQVFSHGGGGSSNPMGWKYTDHPSC